MSDDPQTLLRLGTRGSLLARAQSGLVADLLERRHPGLRVELILFKTSGDQIADKPLYEAGGKGLFVKELEQALLDDAIDFAVHSYKDMPVTMPVVDETNLIVAAVTEREDPRDVLVGSQEAGTLSQLPPGARVGTGSLRRRAQLLALRSDLVIEPVRGNIDTRLRKCGDGEFDAIVLAMAGLRRAGIFDATRMSTLEPEEMLPSPGQGALALQCRRGDQRTRDLLSALNHVETATCVAAEREVVRLLEGDCTSPIAAFAEQRQGVLTLNAVVARRDGKPPLLKVYASGDAGDPLAVARQVFEILKQRGVQALLRGDDAAFLWI